MPVDPTLTPEVPDHTPPLVASDNEVIIPAQTVAEPAIADGTALTVTTDIAEQPDGIVYETEAVPAVTPVTFPKPSTVTFALKDDHEPLPVASLSAIVLPAHTGITPEIAAGAALTVTVAVAVQPKPVV